MQRVHLLRFVLWVLLALCLFGSLALLGAYLYVAGALPKVDTLADYRPPVITRVFSDDGTVIAEFSRERRIVVPVSRMPQQLIQAFVAAEDSHFFHHQGVDLLSILRAAIKNVLAGGIVQGGSTITQQVAKSLLLTPEKKFSRKFKEAILAWRMEKSLSKDDILFLYLNQIYLGHGAYGVQAAAENYFDKNVENLTLAECAMLAGLPQAPSRYSPYQHYDRAKERQKYVLGRMVAEGYLAPLQAEMAAGRELTIHPRVNSHIAEAAYFTEQVRRYLEQRYGEELLYSGGLEVHTSMNLVLQQAAQRAVRDNLRDHDKRRGFRGPLKVLDEPAEAAFLVEQTKALVKEPLVPETLVTGVLAGEREQSLVVRIGDRVGAIPLADCRWAGHPRVLPRGAKATGNANQRETRLPIGSLLQVRILDLPPEGPLKLALEQDPEAQGAIVALDPSNGQVKVLVGGYDFGQSQFNRAVQAKRLPGSAIKPIIYAAALDKGYTPATVILDTPVIYKEKSETGENTEWKPRNYGEKFSGPTTFRAALAHSANVITIKVLEDIGVGYAINYARKLGI
jgi:penicillin-binding protein 1A